MASKSTKSSKSLTFASFFFVEASDEGFLLHPQIFLVPPALLLVIHLDNHSTETRTYQTVDDHLSIRAFVNPRPATPNTPRAATQVDPVFPPTVAFYWAGEPVDGQNFSAWWTDVNGDKAVKKQSRNNGRDFGISPSGLQPLAIDGMSLRS
ncbi:hypothetical protein K438DRAFT_1767373 [Mycena galopus ATCC 62051]|nr:hypothetical protein K438DRAFT_1767373 [Mycena galopus ATCC 62051]